MPMVRQQDVGKNSEFAFAAHSLNSSSQQFTPIVDCQNRPPPIRNNSKEIHPAGNIVTTTFGHSKTTVKSQTHSAESVGRNKRRQTQTTTYTLTTPRSSGRRASQTPILNNQFKRHVYRIKSRNTAPPEPRGDRPHAKRLAHPLVPAYFCWLNDMN